MPEKIREVLPWVPTLLTSCVLAAVLWAFKGIEDLKIQVVKLEAAIEYGMKDRFTGAQGDALDARVVILEKSMVNHEERLDDIEKKL